MNAIYIRKAEEGNVMASARTNNVARNAWFAFIAQVINIVLSFLSRTVFIRLLGAEYLGVNGLFTNILTMLSFAELGIGNAIIYNLYKPLAENDQEKVKSLMALYEKAYKTIGCAIGLLGLLVMPFMGYIVKDAPNIDENINFIYLLFLANTVLSYFLVYKKSIITADQKNYIVSYYHQALHVLQVILQTVFLILTGEYVVFLLIQIMCTALSNIVLSKRADKMYPFLVSGTAEPLAYEERQEIFADVRSLFMYKLGSVVLNGTDNLIISALIGVAAVGLSSNYLLVIAALGTIAGQVVGAFTASIGNLNAVADAERQERVFDCLFFICAWIYGYISVGLYMFLNPFINIWLGHDYLLSNGVVFALVLHFYINSVQFAAYTYRTTMGLFRQGRLAPLFAAVLNIILSIGLANSFGLTGIFLATSIARFFTMGIVDPFLVYRIGFDKSPVPYYIKYFLFGSIFIGLYIGIDYALSWIAVTSVLGLITKAVVMTVLFNGAMILIFRNERNFKDIKRSLVSILRENLTKLGLCE